jgi:hypothetical protein
MKPMEGVALFEKVVFGWLPREPGTTANSSERLPRGRIGRLASFFAFEFLVVFVSLGALQIVGLGGYSAFWAGAVAAISAAAGSALYLKPAKRREPPAQAAGSEADHKHDEAK